MGRCLSVITLCSLAACSWRGPAPLQTEGFPTSPAAIAIDKAAWQLVALKNLDSSRGPEGHLQVAADLTNLSSKDLVVQVQVVFEGALDVDESSWEVLVLPGGETTTYTKGALGTKTEQFSLRIKTP